MAFAEAPTVKELDDARNAFKDGLQLEKDGKFEEALAKFEQTAKVKTTAQVRFHIGLCNEKLGHAVAAIQAYEAAAAQAEADGNAPEVLKVAPDLALKLREKLPRVTVVFAGSVAESLSIDGKNVEGASAKEYALESGPHVVIATLGEEKVREEFTVAEGEHKTISLKLGGSVTAAPPEYTHPSETPHDKPPVVETSASTAPVGWVLVGVGAVGLAASAIFYGIRLSTLSDLDTTCVNGKCPLGASQPISDAKTFTALSGIALGVGLASVGAGIYLIVTAKRPPSEKTARIVPWAPGSNIGLGVEGVF